jgi:translation initiation factor IF-1
MARSDMITMEGMITDVNRGSCKVDLDNGTHVTCTIAGKLRQNKIKLLEGDKVRVRISPYDLTRGIIEWRY